MQIVLKKTTKKLHSNSPSNNIWNPIDGESSTGDVLACVAHILNSTESDIGK